MENQKSYYAIIPANVRYDKRIRPNAKLLYGEITALCNEKGVCWASNSYFADLYSVSKTSISKWIKNLVDCGYVTIQLEYKKHSKEIANRYLRIVKEPTGEKVTPLEQKFNPPTTKVQYPIEQKFNTPLTKVQGPIEQKFKDNNTFNNTNNNTKNILSSKLEEIPYKKIIDYLNQVTGRNYRNVEANKKLIKARWNEGNHFEDFKKVIDIKTADWLKNETYSQYLRPSTLFGPKFDNYLNQVVRQPKIAPGANGVKYRGGKGYGGIEF